MAIYDTPLQRAVIQAAKLGQIKMMQEFIRLGANPFIQDAEGRNAISYAIEADPDKTRPILMELSATASMYRVREESDAE